MTTTNEKEDCDAEEKFIPIEEEGFIHSFSCSVTTKKMIKWMLFHR